MQREIKFKGKRVDNGEWVEGDLITTPDPFKQDCILEFIGCPRVFVEVDPETVCQFPNKKYLTGRDVYENDIAFEEIEEDEGDIRYYYVCTWINEWSRFAWLHVIGEYPNYIEQGAESLDYALQETFSLENENMHYAGNIFDNPELLKQENNENETEK